MGAILRRRCGPFAVACFLALGFAATAAADSPSIYLGKTLAQALQELQSRGLRMVFADNVVLPDMRVESEPRPGAPRQVLAELLAPHGLAAREAPGGVVVVVPVASSGADGEDTEGRPAAVFAEELYVTPSGVSMMRSQPVAMVALSRDEILALPHLGDDFFRSLTVLPGATANDISAHFNLRGAWRDETQVVLDGQELYEAYHLEDLDDASSVIATSSLAAADFLTGGFPARYGDRMAGVLDLQTRTPDGAARTWVGVAASSLEAGGAGGLGGERGSWMIEARRGAIDLLARLLGDEDPSYWDAFGKVDVSLGRRNSLRVNGLYADDRLLFDQEQAGDFKHHDTAYRSSYLWGTLRTLLDPSLYVETSASASRSNRDRSGVEIEEDAGFVIRDRRDFDVVELGQDWSFEASPRQSLSWGARLRHESIDYDYHGVVDFDNPLAGIRHDVGRGSTVFVGEFDNDQQSAYADDRLRFGERFSAEVGLRYDRASLGGEDIVSPRAGLAWTVGERNVLRLAWGRYTQSQRIYELQVEDGETEFAPVERAEHRILGFERLFSGRGGLGLRVELYQREVENPRPRYGNLFESVNTFPEAEPDRVRLASDRSRAEGMEIFLRGTTAAKLRWSASYTLARTQDRLDSRWLPRPFDETHAVKLDFDYTLGPNWRLNLAWRFHTGWPTTPLAFVAVPAGEEGEDDEIVLVPVLGPVGSERLPSYHRLDLRASRGWHTRAMAWEFFVDVQNLYDRRNVAGFDIEVDEDGNILRSVETWTGILPTAGVRVEF